MQCAGAGRVHRRGTHQMVGAPQRSRQSGVPELGPGGREARSRAHGCS